MVKRSRSSLEVTWSFVPTNNYQVAPTDVGAIHGMAAAQQQAAYNSQVRSQGAALGGLFGLAERVGARAGARRN